MAPTLQHVLVGLHGNAVLSRTHKHGEHFVNLYSANTMLQVSRLALEICSNALQLKDLIYEFCTQPLHVHVR